jgi:hypothetical protein
MQFMAWVDKQRLPSPEAILANPQAFQVPRRFDLARALIAGCVGYAKKQGDPETWESLMDLNEVIFTQRREIAISMNGTVWNAKPADYEPRIRAGVAEEIADLVIGAAK